MKKLLILLPIFILFTITGCKKYLQPLLDDQLTLDQVFQDRNQSDMYLASIYDYIPDNLFFMYTNTDNPVFFATDDAKITYTTTESAKINAGSWSPSETGVSFYWTRYYQGIRAASIYIDKIPSNTQYSSTEIPNLVAQAKTLRAYYYFLLLRLYGPVVILDKAASTSVSASDLQYPRSPFDSCVNYIVSELDAATPDLPITTSVTNDIGHVTQLFAMALKERVLLYAASPLFNGNSDYSTFVNADKTPFFSAYDASKWKRASDAGKGLITLARANGLNLYRENTAGVYDPRKSYENTFTIRYNSEIIFSRPPSSSSSGSTGIEQFGTPRQFNGGNNLCVTQELVDAFRTTNGKTIDDINSGYVETGFSTANDATTVSGTWNMYRNREPRFYAMITFNNSQWRAYGTTVNSKVELFYKGKSGKSGGGTAFSPTGYLLRKYIGVSSDDPLTVGTTIDVKNSKYSTTKNGIVFRLGEFYLDYAEALNESTPGDPDILTYLNLIRDRGGIPILAGSYTQDAMRILIRQERRIELALEAGNRYYDTRRWKIAMTALGGPKTGMNVDAGATATDPAFYQRTTFETRVFQLKNYLWPIPLNETYKDAKLVQNPGW